MADVVGYSRLMAADEEGTVAQLKANRKELIIPKQEEYHGRIVKLMGDGALMEFGSVVDAVNFAIDVQRANKKRNEDIPQDRQISYRIGISIGDIIVDREDIYGGEVNISARLESICEPDCIYLTEDAYHQAENKVDATFEALGKKTLKNIPEPVSVYRVLLDSTAAEGTELPKKKAPSRILRPALIVSVITAVLIASVFYSRQLQPPTDQSAENNITAPATESAAIIPEGKASIAVLPFDNMSGDPEQEYFSDGISEDIITDLSQLSNLGVTARNSSFAYKGTSVNIQDVANELGVRYVLEGSVRKSGDRVRITAQLIDATSGQHLWAERYDRRLIDFFDLQDEIRVEIVSALSIQLAGDEGEHLLRKQTNSFEAYDLFLQGQRRYYEFNNEGLEQAKTLYSQAIELDPEFARAYGALGIALVRQTAFIPTSQVNEHLDQALEAAQQAVSIEATSPQAQWALGFVHMWRGEYEQAAKAVQESVTLFPNYADGWGLLALINNQLGRGDQALRFIRKGMELNPGYSFDYPYNEGRAYYNLGEYEKAVKSLLLALERNENAINPRLYLAASYVRLGQIEDAEWEITQLEALSPEISLGHIEKITPMVGGDHRIRFFDDLRKAGVSK
jgi:TolB-like protein/class 3 adenylate cyclase/cytochrome c-type biogenesis protein CcmH/NrfG